MALVAVISTRSTIINAVLVDCRFSMFWYDRHLFVSVVILNKIVHSLVNLMVDYRSE
jgi:uncharacterized protein with von Willebrand factor type A (vWA) domain